MTARSRMATALIASLFLPLWAAAQEMVPVTDLDAFLDRTHHALVAQATWTPPTDTVRDGLIHAVVALAQGIETCDAGALARANKAAEASGYTLRRLHGEGVDDVLILAERTATGGVFGAFRCGGDGAHADILLQAPHAIFDLHTDDIVRAAFASGSVRAAMWNTVHRYRSTPGEVPADPVHPADVTHQTASLFQSATLAWLAARPRARVVQIHGFGRESVDGDVVLSSGVTTRPPTGLRTPVALALELPPERVRVFGIDTDQLGATTNVTARQLADAQPARFVHVELSKGVRDALAEAPSRCVALVLAIGGTPWAF